MLIAQQTKVASVWTVVGIVFIVLRLADAISWPWVWVLAPFWIPFFLGLIIFLIILFVTAIALVWRD